MSYFSPSNKKIANDLSMFTYESSEGTFEIPDSESLINIQDSKFEFQYLN